MSCHLVSHFNASRNHSTPTQSGVNVTIVTPLELLDFMHYKINAPNQLYLFYIHKPGSYEFKMHRLYLYLIRKPGSHVFETHWMY